MTSRLYSNSTNLARRDALPNLDAQREISSPHSLHQEQILRLGRLHELSGLSGRDGEGLFAQDVLAGFQRQHGVLEMVAVRCCDVDDVDIGVGDKLWIGSICLGVKGTVYCLEKLIRPLLAARGGDGNNLVAHIMSVSNFGIAQKILAECCYVGVSSMHGRAPLN